MIIIALALSLNVSAQWTNKSVNNGFDDPYRICYTAENNGAILKLENIDGSIYFYLQGGYTCDEDPVVDLSFLVNGVHLGPWSHGPDLLGINLYKSDTGLISTNPL